MKIEDVVMYLICLIDWGRSICNRGRKGTGVFENVFVWRKKMMGVWNTVN